MHFLALLTISVAFDGLFQVYFQEMLYRPGFSLHPEREQQQQQQTNPPPTDLKVFSFLIGPSGQVPARLFEPPNPLPVRRFSTAAKVATLPPSHDRPPASQTKLKFI